MAKTGGNERPKVMPAARHSVRRSWNLDLPSSPDDSTERGARAEVGAVAAWKCLVARVKMSAKVVA